MKIVYANANTSVVTKTGSSVLIRWGEHWPATDPIVLEHPSLFTDDPTVGLRVTAPLVDDQADSDDQGAADPANGSTEPPAPTANDPVEQATAAPGERRKRTTKRGGE